MKKKNDNNNYLQKNTLFLNLYKFKSIKCKIKIKHNKKCCTFYHNQKDKRRNILIYKYSKEICKEYYLKKCKKDCNFSHNIVESLYHPDSYKKKFCYKFLKLGKCDFEKFCSFAHCEEELRIKLIHKLKQNYLFFLVYFKTEFCPLGVIDHNLKTCVYSHNYQDFKRNFLFNKIPIFCIYWNIKINYKYYDQGCKIGFNCEYIHGWNELIFHYYNYKKNICKEKDSCKNLLICKNLHDNQKKFNLKGFFIPFFQPLY